MWIDAAPGDVVDRLTILELKLEKIPDPEKLAPVRREYAALSRALAEAPAIEGLGDLRAALKAVNAQLWQVEDDLRDCERAKDFGPRFVDLARSVYRLNDERCTLKRAIDRAAGSAFTEVKSYAPY